MSDKPNDGGSLPDSASPPGKPEKLKNVSAVQGSEPLLAELDELRAAQAAELAEDMQAFNERPRPPWYGHDASPQDPVTPEIPGPAADPTLVSDEARLAWLEIQKLPVSERQAAVAKFNRDYPEAARVAGRINDGGTSVTIGDQTVSYKEE
jgi:hypothetical protein